VNGVAPALIDLLESLLGPPSPVRLRAFDGSEAGPTGAPLVDIRSPDALRYLFGRPGQLGLARAYITGTIEVEGDLACVLGSVAADLAERTIHRHWPSARSLKVAARAALLEPDGSLARRWPARPSSEIELPCSPLPRQRNGPDRDRAIIAHHYDLGNDFYELLLDPTMSYSCAWFEGDAPGDGLAEAQHAKLDRICNKLSLAPGQRLIDIGCGWGALSLHAAAHYGVEVVAVTLSKNQASYVRQRAAALGLTERVEVLHRDVRDLADQGGFDAAASIEMGEHAGRKGYPAFARQLYELIRPGCPVLIQQMSRDRGERSGGPFIEHFIAPEMELRPLGETVGLLQAAGLEVLDVEAMREHYARTISAWYQTLVSRYPEFVAIAGEETARVWRCYLAGTALAFEHRRAGVEQFLAVRPR
jgi:cyclopropane-fatty-acyl-phospholipid synthase